MDLKQAYEVLGVPNGSSMEEVNKRYDLLLLKAHNRKKQEGNYAFDQDMDKQSEAYNLIKEHFKLAEMEKFEQEKYGNSKGKTRQKVDHFWEYYKMHVIGGIIGIIVIVMIVQAVINHRQQANLPPPDLEIMAFGNFPVADAEALETQMLEAFPEWQRVKVTVTSVDFTSENGPDYAMLQRAIVLLATERPHLYILDEGSFAWLLPQQVYEPLESLTKTDPQRFVIGNMKPNSDEDISKLDPQLLEDRAYGVNTTDSALWETLRSPNTEKIVTFSSHHGLNEQAQQFLQYLLTNKGK